ncbi:hypothetical protein ACED29_00160 [Shewanella sp. 5S214]|uniref:hypothetical protein n=1 Tax=Shewanella sp. 5S214 TaxID=3229999 RepID=UPI00352D3934
MRKQCIGISEYFATGEGVTYVIASGTEAQIREFAGDYFSIGLAFYSFEDIKHALSQSEELTEELVMNDTRLRAAYVLRTHLPSVVQFIKQNGFATFSYKCHYNLS